MNHKYLAVTVAATMAALTACTPAEESMSQSQLEEYCGIDLDQLKKDLQEENPMIEDIQIIDTDCKTRVTYRDGNEMKSTDMDNDLLMGMLAAGALGAVAGYAMGDNDRGYYTSRYKRDRDRGAFVSPYVSSNSRAASAYRTSNRASGINVSSKTGAVTTRSNPFRGTSSVARSSSYSGG